VLSGLSSSKEAIESGAFLNAKLQRFKIIEKRKLFCIIIKANEL